MTRRRLFLFILLLAAVVPLSAEPQGTHKNAVEPVTATELNVPTQVVIGSCLLPAGLYLVKCDREQVTFTLKKTGERMVEITCKGPLMTKSATETRAVLVDQPSGYVVMEKLYLKGNNVEHVF